MSRERLLKHPPVLFLEHIALNLNPRCLPKLRLYNSLSGFVRHIKFWLCVGLLAVRQARVRFSPRHPMGVFPTEEIERNLSEWRLYESTV